MGSHLRGKEDLDVWDESRAKLAKAERMGLGDRLFAQLRISYDALGKSERRMFLDVATVFLGRRAGTALRAWRACVAQHALLCGAQPCSCAPTQSGHLRKLLCSSMDRAQTCCAHG